MRLYHLTGAGTVAHGDVTYKAAEDGGFDFPPDLEAHMHALAVGGQRQWETAIERQQREIAAELARRQSPEALYEAVSKLVRLGETVVTPAPDPAPAKEQPKEPAKDAAKTRARRSTSPAE